MDRGIGPSFTIRARKARCLSSSLGGTPGEGMLMRPAGPCSLKRITQSRSVWRSIPPILAASSREAPSSTAANRQQPARLRDILRALRKPANLAGRIVRPHRNRLAHGKHPPFATLNHAARDSEIPGESAVQRVGISEFPAPRIKFVGEQDGPSERRLKDALCRGLRADLTVVRAYLARVVYDGNTPGVMLGLLTIGDESAKLAEQIGAVFASILQRQSASRYYFSVRRTGRRNPQRVPGFYERRT